MKEEAIGLPNTTNSYLNIITLGDFDICYQEQSLLTGIHRSYKLLELLQYFIAFRNRRMLPETIIDDLWPDGNFSDPKNVLRAQVHRLRKVLENIRTITKCQPERCLQLTYANGYYLFSVGVHCLVDTDVFEATIKCADSVAKEDKQAAIGLYRQALRLYKGQYLNGTTGNEWLFPLQNRYHRLFLQALYHLLELLDGSGLHDEVTEICEMATLIEPYETTLHLYFLRALIGLGDIQGALSHYNYITSLLYKELGVKPSAAMRALYRQIQGMTQDNDETNLILIEKKLTDDDDMAGAVSCDIDYFRFLYRLERRKSERMSTPSFLGLITASKHKKQLTDSMVEGVMNELMQVLELSLRRGDVFSLWNKTQILLLLTVRQYQDIDTITERLRSCFQEITRRAKVKLSIRFQPLSQERFVIN
jgi:DNA-binding SARP family transcriptional activator